jgi:hypothetical protein
VKLIFIKELLSYFYISWQLMPNVLIQTDFEFKFQLVLACITNNINHKNMAAKGKGKTGKVAARGSKKSVGKRN